MTGLSVEELNRLVDEALKRHLVPPATRSSCRDLQRRLLDDVDASGKISSVALAASMSANTCSNGHQLRIADVHALGLLKHTEDGSLRLSDHGEDWLLTHGRPAPVWHKQVPQTLPRLREWQVEALDAWAAHGRHGVIQAVTGTGKSRVGVEAVREALSHDVSVVVCVPTVDLVDQWHRALLDGGIRSVGKLSASSKSTFRTHDVIVGTVQSLYRKPPVRSDGKVLLIADECHRYGSAEWSAVLQETYLCRLGLTATFERNDDGITDLLDYFGGTPVFDIDFTRAIADGVVAHYDVKLVGVSLDPGERDTYDEADRVVKDTRKALLAYGLPENPFGAFIHAVAKISEERDHPMCSAARQYLRAFSQRIDVLASASAKVDVARRLKHIVNASQGALFFTRRIAACHELADALVDGGIQAAPIHSDLGRNERVDLLRSLKSGKLKALVAPTILDEGIDVPEADLAVVMGGSKSRRQMIQRMGRVLRLKKDEASQVFCRSYTGCGSRLRVA